MALHFIRPRPGDHDDPIVTAVKRAYEESEQDLFDAESEEEFAESELAKKRAIADKVRADRGAWLAFLQERGVEFENHVATLPKPAAESPVGVASKSLAPRGFRREVIERVTAMLGGGKRMHSQPILDALISQGVEFTAENPLHRVRQILSLHNKFGNDRVSGWYLKADATGGENPGASNSSTATSTPTPEVAGRKESP